MFQENKDTLPQGRVSSLFTVVKWKHNAMSPLQYSYLLYTLFRLHLCSVEAEIHIVFLSKIGQVREFTNESVKQIIHTSDLWIGICFQNSHVMRIFSLSSA